MTKKVILPGATIGIIGGGQLGRMITIAGKNMGYNFICQDPTPNCSCSQVADEHIVGGLNDLDAALKLAEKSDVLIFETENIDVGMVQELEKRYYVPLKSSVLAVAQDRIQEKQQLHNAGFAVAPFAVVRNAPDLARAVEEIGYPAVLKTARGGYDGKGQLVLKTPADFDRANDMVQSAEYSAWVLEKMISFTHEMSVIVARQQTGETEVFPVVENIHKENILHLSVVPARIPPTAALAAAEIALGVAKHLDVVGLLAVEFFATEEGVLINEIAPRPHNSGHYTMDACYTSQFEQIIRAVCGLPLGSTQLLTPVVMYNILSGDVPKLMEKIPELSPDVKVHLYGKGDTPPLKRKMGHLNIKTDNPEEAEKTIKSLLA